MIVQFNGRLCRISGTLLKGTKATKVSIEGKLKKEQFGYVVNLTRLEESMRNNA